MRRARRHGAAVMAEIKISDGVSSSAAAGYAIEVQHIVKKYGDFTAVERRLLM